MKLSSILGGFVVIVFLAGLFTALAIGYELTETPEFFGDWFEERCWSLDECEDIHGR